MKFNVELSESIFFLKNCVEFLESKKKKTTHQKTKTTKQRKNRTQKPLTNRPQHLCLVDFYGKGGAEGLNV